MSSVGARPARGARVVEVRAQAKVNVRLRILARETTGFHQLETLFLRVELADTVRIRRTLGTFSVDVIGDVDLALLGPPDGNLALRAARAYAVASGLSGGAAIEIEKRIPIGGGMGGGSADAGAVLRALDAMSETPIGTDALLKVAATLGSDVPFVASEAAYALAWGRGERMLALSAPPSREMVLLVPSISVNTAEAYAWLAAKRVSEPARPEALALDVANLTYWEQIRAVCGNDFEPVVAERHPVISTSISALRDSGFPIAMMSGSGSTVFGIDDEVSTALPSLHDSVRVIATRTSTSVAPVRIIAS